jgi:hypothetical protein
MKRVRGHGGRGDIPGQFQIDWSGVGKPAAVFDTSPLPAPDSAPLVQRLKWDFKITFPQPTQEALDGGIIPDEDTRPENIRAIHDEHARELLGVLHELDAVLDARRRGVDPRNNKTPMLAPAQERLQKFFETEPVRLVRWWQAQLDVYAEAFGPDAADAFGKAIRAWHAGIEVTLDSPAKAVTMTPEPKPAPKELFPHSSSRRERPRRIPARLPVPWPLPSAVTAGHFGQEEEGKPVRPGPAEVRAITEQHAEKLIDLLDAIASASAAGKAALLESFQNGLATYAEDFGEPAARQLEAYVRRQAGLDSSNRRGR